jgi:hypothetical protein
MVKKRVKKGVSYSVSKSCGFRTKDGALLVSLKDFALFLRTVSDDVLYHHITDSKNDFYNWIRDCMGDASLAEQVLAVGTDKTMLEITILRRLVEVAL